MDVLIVGGGGREHALAWKVARSEKVGRVYVAPGNAGTALEANTQNVDIGAEDIDALLEFAAARRIALTIVGPEAPLVEGIVDRFRESGLRCFGPSRKAAQLEGSKAFCKDFLARHKIPSAEYRTFTQIDPALSYLKQSRIPVVIKADGLAAGKGVIIATSRTEAETAVREMLSGKAFGKAGQRIVIEELLQGEEASFIVITDGKTALPMATSQDHKARDDGDLGPNTGGMGAYSPAPVISPGIHRRIMTDIIEPTLRGMASDGSPYVGFLYAGLMIGDEGLPKVLEYNCRLGDPETQPILMRLKSDLVELCEAALDGNLDRLGADWDPRAALGIVLAAGGYPGDYRKGDVIQGLDHTDSIESKFFHAGTRIQSGQVVTAGGRVLCACALGDGIVQARSRAYELAARVDWQDIYYRMDIGYRAVRRESRFNPS
ncbi:MAG: phosphoribosylamine--glycine ligase [Methylococcaceae bacterium]|nr:phosphoribosylamine--glycine ligase [Methylococcaceae bacterium]MCI0733789.1 phosphoribosylamine--glycine ligase [Methylococcaceae bacterium]